MTTPIFAGHVERGKLVLDAPAKYLVHLSKLEGKRVEIVVRRMRSQRSLQQNAFYWGVIIEILAAHFGYEPQEMHEALKFKFLRIHENELPTVRSTTKLSTKEFGEYVDRVIRWAAQNNVYIPLPNECEYGELGGC